jgi:Bacterial extracellular solute-binding proteins, family 3
VQVVFIPVARDDLLPALAAGKGDIAAADLTITDERQQLVDFSSPVYSNVSEVVVSGPASPAVSSVDDLAGKEVFVRTSSSYYESLIALNKRFAEEKKPAVILKEAPETLEDEDLIEMVNGGLIPLIVVDQHKADLRVALGGSRGRSRAFTLFRDFEANRCIESRIRRVSSPNPVAPDDVVSIAGPNGSALRVKNPAVATIAWTTSPMTHRAARRRSARYRRRSFVFAAGIVTIRCHDKKVRHHGNRIPEHHGSRNDEQAVPDPQNLEDAHDRGHLRIHARARPSPHHRDQVRQGGKGRSKPRYQSEDL